VHIAREGDIKKKKSERQFITRHQDSGIVGIGVKVRNLSGQNIQHLLGSPLELLGQIVCRVQ
jgi:hypothetical protein